MVGSAPGAVRGFAVYLRTIDPATEVPSTELLPGPRKRRTTPYLYSEAQISALIAASESLSCPLRRETYATLIGLLAATGMRIGEAISLDTGDVDLKRGLLVVSGAKFGKSRELALHPSTVEALGSYLRRRRRLCPRASAPSVFISTAGTRLVYCGVHWTFARLVEIAGLRPRSARCRPRIHDLRHSFAVRTVLDGYREDGDPQRRLALLSTYLGHVNPSSAWIWDFSSTQSTSARSGGSRYRPTISRTLSTNSGSLESLKCSKRCG